MVNYILLNKNAKKINRKYSLKQNKLNINSKKTKSFNKQIINLLKVSTRKGRNAKNRQNEFYNKIIKNNKSSDNNSTT